MKIHEAQAGDFVQLTDWWPDVWAEILSVSVLGDSVRITYVRKDKIGKKRQRE